MKKGYLIFLALLIMSGSIFALNNAQFVSQSVSSEMTASHTYQVTVSMKNTGDTVWDSNYRLGSENPMDNTLWGSNRIYLDSGETISPGETKDFTFWIIAPTVAGQYDFQWRMVDESVEWFGEFSNNQQINVMQDSPSDVKVLAFYYGWYGNASENWEHWESADPIGTTTLYMPSLGVYSSLDRNVIEQQVDWAKNAGIDGFIFSWWHLQGELNHFKTGLETLLDVAEEKDFLISIYIETEAEISVADQINYIIDNGYTDSPAWYHKDGKPVFYIWGVVTAPHPGDSNYLNDYWYNTKQQTRIPVYLNAFKFSYAYPYGVDSLHFYLYFEDNSLDDALLSDLLFNVKNYNYGDYSMVVNPGFDNTASSIGGNISIPRNNGARYRLQWDSISDISSLSDYPGYGPDEILITSWNEWHESTSIEPSTEWGTEYLEITSEYTGVTFSLCGNADNNPIDGVVSITELINYIGQWKAGGATIGDLIDAIGKWKSGC